MATGIELPARRQDGYLTPPVVTTTRRERNGNAPQTPPPNYDEFLSENDLPSARTRIARDFSKSNGSHKGSSYTYSRVCVVYRVCVGIHRDYDLCDFVVFIESWQFQIQPVF